MSVALLAMAFAATLFVVFVSALAVQAVRRLRFVPPQVEALSPQDVPPAVRALLAPGLDHLLALGFGKPGALRQVCLMAGGQPQPQFALVLAHHKMPAVAYLVQLTTPDRARHYSICFVSQLRSGATLVTRNRASVQGPLPVAQVTTLDCWLPSWAALWRAHRKGMRAMSAAAAEPWQVRAVSDWIAVGAASEAEAFKNRVQAGDLVRTGDGSYQVAWRWALATLGRAWATFGKSRRTMDGDPPAAAAAAPGTAAAAAPGAAVGAGAAPPANDALAADVQTQVQNYERDSQARHRSAWSNGAKWVVFFVTAAMAAASFGLSMKLGALPALLAVLLFHEMGHFVAMRWAGYKDLKVFFLPFLGAAVSGRHEHPTVRQELLVLFAGPVPGLLLGIAGLLWLPRDVPFADWWHDCAALAVTLNAFNLLPIHPLDGGKIFEILLLSRWPWLAFAGRMVGVLALAGLALSLGSEIGRAVLLGATVLMALGSVQQWREARLATALQRGGQLGGLAREGALRALFERLNQLGYAARPWADQRLLADALLPVLTRPRLRPLARLGGLLVYAFFLALPVLALLVQVWSSQHMPPPASAEQPAAKSLLAQRNRDFETMQARLTALPDAQQRWALLEEELASSVLEAINDHPAGALPAAEALLREAQALAPRLPDALAKQATVATWLAAVEREPVARLRRLQDVFELYDRPEAAAADPGPLLKATADWLYEAPLDDLPARLARIDKSLAVAATRGAAVDLGTLHEFEVDHTLLQGDDAAALQLARGYFEAARRSGNIAQLLQHTYLLVNATQAAKGSDAALQVLDAAMKQIESGPASQAAYTAGLRRHGLWLAESAGRPDWQRLQAPQLAARGPGGAGLPLWSRALLWLLPARPPGSQTLADLERAHWSGDTAQARRIAVAILKQRPDFVVRLANPPSKQPALEGHRVYLLNLARVAVYRSYGIPVLHTPLVAADAQPPGSPPPR